jgi:hypothetical protein
MRKRTIKRDARGVCSARVALIESLRTAFHQRSWHGANLLGSIRSVHATTASQRLGRRKTIWQQVLHAAYWKHVVINKLAGVTRFPPPGEQLAANAGRSPFLAPLAVDFVHACANSLG